MFPRLVEPRFFVQVQTDSPVVTVQRLVEPLKALGRAQEDEKGIGGIRACSLLECDLRLIDTVLISKIL